MPNYYYLGTYLPSLSFETPPEVTFNEFDTLLHDNLTQHDYRQTKIIRRFYDILNLKALWMGEELDPRGNLDRIQLEDALIEQTNFVEYFYVYDFLAKYEKLSDRLHHFPWLLVQFFKTASKEAKGFLRDYLNFERELRLVFTAFRAKKLGRDLSTELQYEDPEEDLIAQMLAQKDAKVYEPPEKYQDLKVLFERYGDNPLELERALDEYRFTYIESLVNMSDFFSLERILAYMTELLIVEKWFEFNKDKGLEIVDTIVKERS